MKKLSLTGLGQPWDTLRIYAIVLSVFTVASVDAGVIVKIDGLYEGQRFRIKKVADYEAFVACAPPSQQSQTQYTSVVLRKTAVEGLQQNGNLVFQTVEGFDIDADGAGVIADVTHTFLGPCTGYSHFREYLVVERAIFVNGQTQWRLYGGANVVFIPAAN